MPAMQAGAPVLAGQQRFGACLHETLEIEGGYSNDPHDRGGPTMAGVTWDVYNAYRDSRGLPRQDVRLVTNEEKVDLYYRFYWLPSHAGEMPMGLDLAVWDFGVNSGPVTAIKQLQRVLGIPADGHFGAVTNAAVRQAYLPKLISAYVEARRSYCRSLKNYWRFKGGWETRWNRIERSALQVAGAHEWAADVVCSPPPPFEQTADERSGEQGRAEGDEPTPPRVTELAMGSSGSTSFAFAAPNIFARAYSGGRWSWSAFAMALFTEPLFWAGMALVWGAVATYLWRRKHKQ